MPTRRDIDRTSVRILGGVAAILIVGIALVNIVHPDTPRESDGAFAVLGTAIGAISGIVAGRRE